MKPETMSSTPTAADRAEKRYPFSIERITWNREASAWHEQVKELMRSGYATCIREEVEPLEAENVKLRALVQTLVDAGEGLSFRIGCGCGPSECTACNGQYQRWFALMRDAASQGFTPTNTTDK